ncbi:MAG: outer membrane beta-barrel protein [Shimia sp.]
MTMRALSTTFTCCLACAAAAGDLTVIAPDPVVITDLLPQAQAPDWTGFSAGVQLSYGDISTTGSNLDGDGFGGGARLYYDYDFGQFVLGAGVQIDQLDIDLDGTAEVGDVFRAGVRAGLHRERNWYYLTAGVADVSTDTLGDASGYFYGLGYEVRLTDRITAGAEVLQHDFDDFSGNPTLEAEAATAGLSLNFRF